LFFFYLFLNALLSFKCVSREIFGGRGQKEHQERKIASISLPPFYQWQVRRGRTGHLPRAHLNRTMHQEPRAKNEDIFMEKNPIPEK